MHGRAAELQRARAAGAAAAADQVGVDRDEADPLDRDAGLGADDHRERRLVPLAVGRGAGHDGRRAVVVDLTAPYSLGAAAGGDLDVRGDADAEQRPVAALAAARLLGAELVVAGEACRPRRAASGTRRCRR